MYKWLHYKYKLSKAVDFVMRLILINIKKINKIKKLIFIKCKVLSSGVLKSHCFISVSHSNRLNSYTLFNFLPYSWSLSKRTYFSWNPYPLIMVFFSFIFSLFVPIFINWAFSPSLIIFPFCFSDPGNQLCDGAELGFTGSFWWRRQHRHHARQLLWYCCVSICLSEY